MIFVKFKNVKNVQDGDYFLVVYPNGGVVLCWYSRRGYFSPETNYLEMMDRSDTDIYESIDITDDLLVSKIILEGDE